MKHSQARSLLTSVFAHNFECAKRGSTLSNDYVVPMFLGDPGVGKTAIPRQVAFELEVPYFETIVAQYDAGEMAGLATIGERIIHDEDDEGQAVQHVHKEMIKLRPDYLPNVFDPNELIGIYNLDEMPQAFLANQNICSQLVNDWRIGKHKVSRGITMCATGNKPENKAGTTPMPMHLKDRLCFFYIEPDLDEFLDYAAVHGLDRRVRAYLRNVRQNFHIFTVGADANPTPRSWEKTSTFLKMELDQQIRTDAIYGQIGPGVGSHFESWLRVEDKMPDLQFVIANPETAPVFDTTNSDILWMLLASLSDATNKHNISNVIKYIRRLPNQEWAQVWAMDATKRNPEIVETRAYTEWKYTDGAKLML